MFIITVAVLSCILYYVFFREKNIYIGFAVILGGSLFNIIKAIISELSLMG